MSQAGWHRGRVCSICRILQNGTDDEIIIITSYWRVTLAPEQSYLGRVYVTLLIHCSSLPGLSREAWADLHTTISRYDALVKRVFGATLLNWACLMNDAVRDSEEPHVHWHGRPRYAVAPRVGALEVPDPNYGWPVDRAAGWYPSRDVLAQIATELRRGLSEERS